MKNLIAATLIATVTATSAFAHGGGLNQNGCHNQHSNGTYHCHRQQPTNNHNFEKEAAKALGALLLFGIIGNAITEASCNKEWRLVAENRTHMKVAEVNCRGQVVQEKIIKK